ncbi:hypothetical protein BN1263290013 [Stenotrophomonas indicatrix]|nr:hypothetical protein BN1263290013 [Stenotrophomonas indicatrix]
MPGGFPTFRRAWPGAADMNTRRNSVTALPGRSGTPLAYPGEATLRSFTPWPQPLTKPRRPPTRTRPPSRAVRS